jgi:hypothetical protein
MELDPLALCSDDHRNRSMNRSKAYALRRRATLRFLPWN